MAASSDKLIQADKRRFLIGLRDDSGRDPTVGVRQVDLLARLELSHKLDVLLEWADRKGWTEVSEADAPLNEINISEAGIAEADRLEKAKRKPKGDRA